MTNCIKRGIATAVCGLLFFWLAGPAALALPILASDGVVHIEQAPSPLGTTSVADPAGGAPVGSLAFGGGSILLEDYANNPLNTYATNPSWWGAAGLAYTTTTSGMLIEFVDLFVTGFTFNIGANQNARAWIRAYYDNGVDESLFTGWFEGIGPGITPSYGVYVSDPTASCARITSIEIDPTFEWGIGNLGVAAGQPASCVSVPEPGPVSLLGMGLLTLSLGQYWSARRRRATPASGER